MQYRIHNATSGHIFGAYPGDTAEEALEAYARDAGYADLATLRSEHDGSDIVVLPLVWRVGATVEDRHGNRVDATVPEALGDLLTTRFVSQADAEEAVWDADFTDYEGWETLEFDYRRD